MKYTAARAEGKPRNTTKGFFDGIAAQGNVDPVFLIIVLVLMSFGLLMLYSASNVYAFSKHGDSAYFLRKQLIFSLIGTALMFAASYVNAGFLSRVTWPLFAAGIALLLAVFVMPSGDFGNKRWIYLGAISFQPSELMKFFIVLAYARIISGYYESGRHEYMMKKTLWGPACLLAVLGVVLALLYFEPHASAMVIFTLMAAVMIFIGGVGWRNILIMTLVIGGAAALFLYFGMKGYMLARLRYWLDPWQDSLDNGYQAIQSLYAIASGGFWGVGLGNSLQKHMYLPFPQNDFIFAIVCEELGFAGAALLAALFVILIWRGYVIAMHAKDKFSGLVAAGIITKVGLQALLNVAVVTNTVPNTGISLPFFSSGGTALVILLAEMGVVLSVSRKSTVEAGRPGAAAPQGEQGPEEQEEEE